MSKYKIEFTNRFKKQYKKMISNSNYRQEDFDKVVNMLENDEILPENYHNHLLEPKINRIREISNKMCKHLKKILSYFFTKLNKCKIKIFLQTSIKIRYLKNQFLLDKIRKFTCNLYPFDLK